MNRKQKEEVLRMYFAQGMETAEIAQRTGAMEAEICRVLGDTALLKPYSERAEAAKLRAMICVNESAEEAARKQAELMRSGEAAGAQTVSQRAAKDILDRAGICLDREDRREIRVTFSGMPEIGMPRGEAQANDGNRA